MWIKLPNRLCPPRPSSLRHSEATDMYRKCLWYRQSRMFFGKIYLVLAFVSFLLLAFVCLLQSGLIRNFVVTTPSSGIISRKRTGNSTTSGFCVDSNALHGEQQVILLTYGRSGSSFTADIVQRHPDVFFNYEPLHDLAKTFSPAQKIYSSQHQNAHLHLTAIPEYLQQAESILASWMTCDFLRLPKVAYNNLHLNRAPATARLRRCLLGSRHDEEKVKRCLAVHRGLCLAFPIHFLKVIRLPTVSVGRLMHKLPKLKLIFLLRDPRGSFLSKKVTFGKMITKNTTYEAERFCVRLVKDVAEAFALHTRFPGRVLITRYESIAAEPMRTSEELYRFLCLPFTEATADYIRGNTRADSQKDDVRGAYSVKRSNSSIASYAWRLKLPYSDAKEFDFYCDQAYRRMGYLPVNNEEHLRDMGRSLKVSVDRVT